MRGRGYWLRIMSLGGLISTLHHAVLSEFTFLYNKTDQMHQFPKFTPA